MHPVSGRKKLSRYVGYGFLILLLLLCFSLITRRVFADETQTAEPETTKKTKTSTAEESTEESSEESTEESTEEETEPVWEGPYEVPLSGFPYDTVSKKTKAVVIIGDGTTNLRADAGTSAEILCYLEKGAVLEYISEKKAADGVTWYEVHSGFYFNEEEVTGYISSVVSRTATFTKGGDNYGTYLSILGFPSDYILALKQMHQKYPQWIFVATNTGQSWSTALYEEANPSYYQGAVSLIYDTNISSWKSIRDGAYDWTTSTWVGYDGPHWVKASDELVAYFLDPRNFLWDDSIFMFLTMLYSSSQTVEGVRRIISDSFMAKEPAKDVNGKKFSYAKLFCEIGASLGISPYYLASTVRQEMGLAGTTKSISGKSELFPGYYNYYNVHAYTTDEYDANDRGLWFASGEGVGNTSYNRPWNTRVKALWGGAMFHAENYLLQNQYTLYYKKFNVASADMRYRHQYMTNIMGAYLEGVSLANGYDAEARQHVLIFDIPVFQNMPSAQCPIPTGTGSPNNRLASIKVGSFSVSPTVDPDNTEYSVIVNDGNTEYEITAVPYDSTATVTGTGTISLSSGTKEITLMVRAENGDSRTYTVNITWVEKPMETEYSWKNGGYITKIEPETKKKEFAENLHIAATAWAEYKNADGTDKADGDLMKTGDKVKVYDAAGQVYRSGTVVIYGDVNGDGKISMADLIKVRNHILEATLQKKCYLKACDVNKDGNVKMSDLIKIRNHILGTILITQ